METQNPLHAHAFELFRSLAENGRDMVHVIDCEGRLLYSNREFSNLLKAPIEALIGRPLEEAFCPSLATAHRELLKEVLTTGTRASRKIQACPENVNRPIEIRLCPLLDSNQKLCAVTGILHCEANHERIQEQLEHTSKLASIGTLAAGIAHEINNPLTVISGNISVLEEIFGNSNENSMILPTIEKMRRSSERITSIVSGMRNYVRVNSDVVMPIDVHSSLKNVLGVVANVYQNSGITVRTDFCTEPTIIRGDAGRLEQIIMNILTNAKDALLAFSKDGIIELKTAVSENKVTLRISDNGSGIPKENLAKIFQPFFTTKPAGMGTGLGLSLCQAMTLSLGGTLQIDSEVGIGTVATLSFKRETQATVPQPTPKENFSQKYSGTVLVVDDEELIRDILGSMLISLGFEVKQAEDGDVALKLLKTEKNFDYIFTDLKMQRVSGQEFLVEAKKFQHRNTKYIIITGGMLMEYTETERAALRELADGFLKKPFQKKMIISLIETLNQKQTN